jgi:uncharacterized protein
MNPDLTAVLQDKLALGMTSALPDFTPRRVEVPAVPGKAQAIIGMRRAGKTTFLYQQMAQRLEGGTPRERLVYINFEDERLASPSVDFLTFLLEEYYRTQPALRGKQKVTWCLDEVQLIPGWESFARRVMDSEKVELFLSGSSAKLLSQEVATAMRGRALATVIHPFSFQESLLHGGKKLPANLQVVSPANRSALEHALSQYLAQGGFPEVQGLSVVNQHALLRSYVDVALLRDVIERHQLGNVTALRFLMRHLLAHAGRHFSVQKVHGLLVSQGLPVAKNTLHDFLAHLEDAFLLRTVWMEAGSERQRMVNPRKVYPIDPALIPLYDPVARANTGHALETVVMLELERRGAAITWLRTEAGSEVDFLARYPDGTQQIIQVCADASATDTAERELRPFTELSPQQRRAQLLLLVMHQSGLPKMDLPKGVVAQPVWQWLLGA